MAQRFSVAIALACVVADPTLAKSAEPLPITADSSPPWDYDAMFRPALKALKREQKAEGVEFRLLAWTVMKNDRGLKVESGLLWLSFQKQGERAWALADVYRHPDQFDSWMLSVIQDSQYEPLRLYASRPTNHDIYQFGSFNWSFSAPPYFFVYLDAHVCRQAWEAATGSKPTKFFPGEKAIARAPSKQPNYQIKPSVAPVTRLACARRAPGPPAAYLGRYAD